MDSWFERLETEGEGMGVTININGLSLAHKGSTGIATATIPDVCKTPSPGGPIPLPYPNVAMVSDLAKGTKTIKTDGKMAANKGSEMSRSSGDEPGTAGGVKSSTFAKEATWMLYSFDVMLEGKNACRLTDKLFMNHQNTVCLAGFVNPIILKKEGLGAYCKALLECIEEIVGKGRTGKSGKHYKDRGLEERMNQNRGVGIKSGQGFGPEDIQIQENGTEKKPWHTHNDEIKRTQNELKEAIEEYETNCAGMGPRGTNKKLQEAKEAADEALPSASEWPHPPRPA